MADLDPTRTYRAAIIGSGSGGLTVAIGLAMLGHDVVLIEGGDVGGDCTNVGCIPSKAFLHAARSGLDDPLGWARGRRDALRDEEDEDLAGHERIALVRGWGRLTDRREPHVVAVTGPDGDEIEVRAEHVVVSTGSRPVRFPIDGVPAERLVTNEELFELDRLPSKVLLVGGGAIALEMATAFADAGAEVAVVEQAPRLLPGEPSEVSDAVAASFVARRIDLRTGTTVERFDPSSDTAHLGDGSTITGVDLVVLAVGRRPRLDGLELTQAGVAHDSHGVDVDAWGRTNVDGIWAVGDVTGTTLTTHGANAVGRRTVRAIALPRLPRLARPRAIPSAIYSRPEIASVGASIEQVERMRPNRRRRYVVRLADLDRGHTDDVAHGVVVVDVERFTGLVLRATVVGPAAAELIGMFTMAIDHRIGLRKLFGMVHPYPAWAEAIGRLADAFARDTYPALPREWSAMSTGRVLDRLGRVVSRR